MDLIGIYKFFKFFEYLNLYRWPQKGRTFSNHKGLAMPLCSCKQVSHFVPNHATRSAPNHGCYICDVLFIICYRPPSICTQLG